MTQIYDISSHLIFFKQYNILNNILKEESEENGIYSKLFNKININDSKVLENIQKDLKSKNSILYTKYF